MALLLRTVRDEAKSLMGWTIFVAVSTFAYMIFYKYAITSGAWKDLASMIDNMPPMIKALMGGNVNLDTMSGFLQALVFNGLLLLCFTIFSVIAALSLVTRDMDARTMEFVLSLPVQRWHVFCARGAVLLSQIAILQGVLVVTAWIGAVVIGKTPDIKLLAMAGVFGWALFFCVSGLFALASTFIDDYQKGLFLLLGAGLVLYFMAAALETGGNTITPVNYINPFAHYDTRALFQTGKLPVSDVLGLLAAGAALWAGSVRSFQRKQI